MPDDTPGIPAGWYPHPDKPGIQIWWTGAGWSDQTRPTPTAPTIDPATPTDQVLGTAGVKLKGRSGGYGVAVVVVVAAIVLAFGVGLVGAFTSGKTSAPAATTENSYTQPPRAAGQPPPIVTYEVWGAADGTGVTYSTPTGMQQHDVTLPMQNTKGGVVSFQADSGTFLYLSAQIKGDVGFLTCKIAVDGVTLAENTSSGAYSIATCKGTMP